MLHDKKVMKFQSSKNMSNFVCEKGTFSQVQSQMTFTQFDLLYL